MPLTYHDHNLLFSYSQVFPVVDWDAFKSIVPAIVSFDKKHKGKTTYTNTKSYLSNHK